MLTPYTVRLTCMVNHVSDSDSTNEKCVFSQWFSCCLSVLLLSNNKYFVLLVERTDNMHGKIHKLLDNILISWATSNHWVQILQLEDGSFISKLKDEIKEPESNHLIKEIHQLTNFETNNLKEIFFKLSNIEKSRRCETPHSRQQFTCVIICTKLSIFMKFFHIRKDQRSERHFMHTEEEAIFEIEPVLNNSGESMHIFFISKSSPCQFRGKHKACFELLTEKSGDWKRHGHHVFVGYYEPWGDGHFRKCDQTYTTNELKNLDDYKSCLQFKISFSKKQTAEIWKLFKDENLPLKLRHLISQEIKCLIVKLCKRNDTYNGHHTFFSENVSKFSTEIDPNFMDGISGKIREEWNSELEKKFSKVSDQKLNKKRNEQKVKFTETNCTTLILYQIPENSSSSTPIE